MVDKLIQYLYTSDYSDADNYLLCENTTGCASESVKDSNMSDEEEGKAESPLRTEEPQKLSLNAGMYIAGDRYDLSGLKDLARQKFSTALVDRWDKEDLPDVIRTIYEETLSTDRALRDSLTPTLQKHKQALREDEGFMEVVKSHGDFAVDLIDAWGSARKCETLRLSRKNYLHYGQHMCSVQCNHGTIKTYARGRERAPSFNDGDFPRKRIRMDTDGTAIEEHINMPAEDPPLIAPEDRLPSSSTAPSSSPAPEQNLFSDPGVDQEGRPESPLSSPPPRLPSPEPATKKSTFSFLKRKRSLRSQDITTPATEPLTDIAPNIQSEVPRPRKRSRLTQMQIDLGGETQKTCKGCGMEYVPSNREDARLHMEFHVMNIGGVDVGKTFLSSKDGGLKRAYPRDRKWLSSGEDMVMVDRKSPPWARNKVKKVLEIVNTELGSAEIADDQLWASLTPNAERPHLSTKKKKLDNSGSDGGGERFKAFIHIEKEKCIGFCLAEKISNARRVIDPKVNQDQKAESGPALRSSSIVTSVELDLALLGVSRIWISKSHRGHGLAAELLETARSNFFYGMEVPKQLVAFSQPTESGGKLAERWFGEKTGWLVYGEKR
ncbi:MAG: hypothetical protein Q9219_001474 [cf. Caloplaca sp. 3 TL-2023]